MKRLLALVSLVLVVGGAGFTGGVLVGRLGTKGPGAEPASIEASRIIFSAQNSTETYYDFDLLAVKPDGMGVTNLTKSPGDDLSGAWSPDGTMIAFCRPNGIFVMAPDGSGRRRVTKHQLAKSLTPFRNAEGDCSPTWSPDGTWLAFSSDREDPGNMDIYVMRSDGGAIARLTDDPAIDEYPAWSPDGDWIAFDRRFPGLYGPEADIFLIRPDGTGLAQITDTLGLDLTPTWSPTGTEIAFSMEVPAGDVGHWEGGPRTIAIMNADGSGIRRITQIHPFAADDQPSWSPDGRWIAFARMVADQGDRPPWRRGIYIVRVDGGGLSLVSERGGYFDTGPSWRPVPTH